MTGEILAGIVLLALGFHTFFLKKTIKLGAYTNLFFHQLIGTLTLLVVGLFTLSFKMPNNLAVASLLVMSLVGVAGLYLFYQAVARGSVSVVFLAIFAFVLISTPVSWVLFGVSHKIINYLAVPLILVGLLLSLIRDIGGFRPKLFSKHLVSHSEPGALLALAAGALAGIYRLGFYFTVRSAGVHRTLVYTSLIILLFVLFPLLSRPFKRLVTMPDKNSWRWLGLSMASLVIALISLYFTFAHLLIDKAFKIIVVAPLLTLLLAGIFLKERFKIHQYIGILLALAGYVMILI